MPQGETSAAGLPAKAAVDETFRLSDALVPLRAGERVRWLHEQLGGRLVATTSFGIQSAVMLHLIHEHAPEIPIVFIDTGYLFPETYRHIENLSRLLDRLDLRVYQPAMTAARMEALWGRLWEGGGEDLDRYSMLTKIEPMNRALRELGADVWMSGLRRSQSETRSGRSFVERQRKTLKAYPILDWADAQVEMYLREHDLPRHPLADKGYVTTGDWHSTLPLPDAGSAQSTRFGGERYECGLHLDSSDADFQI